VVHLFEWKWTDIARECETVLGPAGVWAVQVSPPQEHSLTPSRDWSQRYQPVSYSVEKSRSGTGDEFRQMVTRCRTAGVGILVDAVINHMTNFPSPGTGSNGTSYTKYNYPGLWSAADFHSPCPLTNYQDAAVVQECELFSLPDLNTGSASVRQKLAEYLLALSRMGVAGFRIDAAKHIQQVELDDIVARVNNALVGEGRPRPYWFLEISGGSGEALTEADFYGVGYASGGASDITEFTFTGTGNKFRNLNGEFIAQLNPNGPPGSQFSEQAWGIMPTDKAVVFLQNHDTQRSCGIGYRDGAVFRLANVWMLAQPYGFPSVLSGYAFNCPGEASRGPPSDAAGNTNDVACAPALETASPGQWTCEHRDPHILAMVGFRTVVAGTAVTRWWDNGANAIAFSRGDRGFVAINNETSAVEVAATTGLAAGTYCDRISGGLAGGACAGTAVAIDAAGAARIRLEPRTAVAIDVTTRR
jgi:alpha-amylase